MSNNNYKKQKTSHDSLEKKVNDNIEENEAGSSKNSANEKNEDPMKDNKMNIQEAPISKAVCAKSQDINKLGCNNLKELDAINNHFHSGYNPPPQDQSVFVEAIVIRCRSSLSKLSITDKCSQSTIDAIAKYCINVTDFTIHIYGDNDNDLSLLLLNMSKLKKITIRVYNDIFNDGIFQSVNRTVESFEIYFDKKSCYNCSNNFVLMLQRFEELQVLTMINAIIDQNFESVIPTLKKNLKTLDLHDAIFLNDRLRFDELTKLEELQVSGIRQINNVCLQGFAITLKNLTTLNVSDCRYIDDSGFSLISNFLKLVLLDVSSTAITDNALKSFAVLKNLKDFVCSETKVTDIGIVSVLENSPLTYLNVEHTGITRVTLIAASSILDVDQSDRKLAIVIDAQLASKMDSLSTKIKILQF